MKATQLLHDLGQSLWLDNMTGKFLNDAGNQTVRTKRSSEAAARQLNSTI
jgi:hypothetical protein